MVVASDIDGGDGSAAGAYFGELAGNAVVDDEIGAMRSGAGKVLEV